MPFYRSFRFLFFLYLLAFLYRQRKVPPTRLSLLNLQVVSCIVIATIQRNEEIISHNGRHCINSIRLNILHRLNASGSRLVKYYATYTYIRLFAYQTEAILDLLRRFRFTAQRNISCYHHTEFIYKLYTKLCVFRSFLNTFASILQDVKLNCIDLFEASNKSSTLLLHVFSRHVALDPQHLSIFSWE